MVSELASWVRSVLVLCSQFFGFFLQEQGKKFRGRKLPLDKFSHNPRDPKQYKYESMIIFVYMATAPFLIAASNDPYANSLFLTFYGWVMCGVHALVMLLLAFADWKKEWHHMLPIGDVPVLFIFAFGTLFLLVKAQAEKQRGE